MKREQLAKVISELDDRHIADCVHYAPEGTAGSSERGRHMNVKRIVTLALAAVLILSLGVTAYAVKTSVASPEAAQ
ncbi:MAG: hypothetical protein IKE47_04520 [Oscillospiraceae bacterium]|nr:hypothetical protein [Oscillospiraceae bacterium]